MKQIIILFLFCIISLTRFSQDKVLELKGVFFQDKSKRRKSYAISNQKNNDLLIITKEGLLISAVLLDANTIYTLNLLEEKGTF